MPEICYVDKTFTDDAIRAIANARAICAAYQQQGYDLTLRQLYYQFVARDLFPTQRSWSQLGSGRWVRDPNGTPNAEPNYKWLGGVINDARLAGLLDWKYIVDRTRNLKGGTGIDADPADYISAAASSYNVDRWENQPYHVEVWIEKDALIGVLDRACPPYQVNYFSCRGYTSQSEVWGAARRLGRYIDDGKQVVIIHLGDHDPSGIDMSRDIEDRLSMFIAQDRGSPTGLEAWEYRQEVEDVFELNRVALNMAQVRRYNPPPNPAKVSDSRSAGYIERFGNSSWELDALDPATLTDLIGTTIELYRDEELFEETMDRENAEKQILVTLHSHWNDVADHLRETYPDELNGAGE